MVSSFVVLGTSACAGHLVCRGRRDLASPFRMLLCCCLAGSRSRTSLEFPFPNPTNPCMWKTGIYLARSRLRGRTRELFRNFLSSSLPRQFDSCGNRIDTLCLFGWSTSCLGSCRFRFPIRCYPSISAGNRLNFVFLLINRFIATSTINFNLFLIRGLSVDTVYMWV
jgi:hypothetical protein